MTELPEEIGQALGRLGRVAPPEPGVLDAARESLWTAVAAEMLAARPAGEAGRTGGSRRAAEGEAGQPGQSRRGSPDG